MASKQSSSWRTRLLQLTETTTLQQILWIALSWRCLVGTLMALSCAIIPNHNPGNDVLQFPIDIPGDFDGNPLQTHVYPFILTPATRWDAARFLWLAVDPKRRWYLHDLTVAEEAHAFLPLFPMTIRLTASLLNWLLPAALLPATVAQTHIFAALLVNVLCFISATADLHHMSGLLLQKRNQTNLAALLFVFNPATVFFGAAYSESLGAALLFRGCRVALQFRSITGLLAATFFWWLAAWTRSNALLYGGFLILQGLGQVCSCRAWWHLVTTTLLSVVLNVTSMGWHNYQGHERLCEKSVEDQPEYCIQGPFFHLYGHVQRKHWNVGFLRYYTMNQIPNFLLAAPLLILSSMATMKWIRESWQQWADPADKRPKHFVNQFVSWVYRALAASVTSEGTASTLGCYAVLAASTLLCVTLAHVQIATRLICSSCPALYWYLAGVVSQTDSIMGERVLQYFTLYIVLGIIMHPNWLPWT